LSFVIKAKIPFVLKLYKQQQHHNYNFKMEAVLSFMELTNLPIEEAKRYLSAAGNILEVAIQNYYDSQQGDFPQELEPQQPEQPQYDEIDEDEVRPALPREYSQLVEEESVRNIQLNRVKRQFSSSFRDLKKEMEIQENLAKGIAPKRKCLEDIYRNPIEITYNLDLPSAKHVGQKHGKWIALLINDETFPSLSFNRDIFNDSTQKVKQIMKKNFILLRKNANCDESLRILQNYNLIHQAIPVFLIIDSLTGELKKNFGETKDLSPKTVIRELKKYSSTEDKQLQYVSPTSFNSTYH
jgi:UBA-like domain